MTDDCADTAGRKLGPPYKMSQDAWADERTDRLDKMLVLLMIEGKLTGEELLDAFLAHAGAYYTAHRNLTKAGTQSEFAARVGKKYTGKPFHPDTARELARGKAVGISVGKWLAMMLECGLMPALLSRANELVYGKGWRKAAGSKYLKKERRKLMAEAREAENV